MTGQRILIIGASGFLGTNLYDRFFGGNEVLGTYFQQSRKDLVHLDITDRQKTLHIIKDFKPHIVIHTVALSDPDYCEDHPEETWAINYQGTVNIVTACETLGTALHYISTVYVFDGVKGNFSETDRPNPIEQQYARSKYRAEQEVMRLANSCIYRFDILYGLNGEGKPNGLIGKVMAGKPFSVNNDQNRQPLFVNDVSRTIERLHNLHRFGIFHLAGPDKMTKYELTLGLARLLDQEYLV